MAQRIFDREDPTPGMPEQKEIAGIEAECYTHLFDLVDETRDFLQVWNVGLVAVM